MSSISKKDRDILRTLAGELRTIAELPEQRRRIQEWTAHNDLHSKHPMVLCFPEGAWVELLPPEALSCEGQLAREFETSLRQRLFSWHEIADDHVVTATFDIPWVFAEGSYGVPIPYHFGDDRGSYIWEPPISDIAQATKVLRRREPRVDEEATQVRTEAAQAAFGDLLHCRRSGSFYWTLGMTWKVIDLVGLENLMLYMLDAPEAVHELMAWMRDEHLHYIEWFESRGYLTGNHEDQYVGSGGVGYTRVLPGPGTQPPFRNMDRWGFAESQETVGISPEMFAEFILPYQAPLLERFGLNYYGCCEPLHLRWDAVKTLPRLRRVSVSPWADVPWMAEALEDRYVFCRKPNPAPLCVGFDETALERDLRETLAATRGCVLELIMKDTHTIQRDAKRLGRWVQMARKAIDRVGALSPV